MIKNAFSAIVSLYSNDTLADELWNEVVVHYSHKKRHYHNLQHLENMFSELDVVKTSLSDWETTIMALVYHDIVYKPTAKDNEEKSAVHAVQKLQQMKFTPEKIEKCQTMILATKSHAASVDSDINFFTDSDLSILGKPWPVYVEYLLNVRKEYSLYPDILYNPGRKKVLGHFLSMDRIFKTEFFYQRYEQHAKSNMTKEREQL